MYYYFRRWQADGRWARLNQAFVRRQREQVAPSRQPSPSVVVLDAQSSKCSEWGGARQGLRGAQENQGRKRPLVVDTGGLLLAAHVGPAHENDWLGARAVLPTLRQPELERLRLVLADAGYVGQPLAEWTRLHGGWALQTTPGLSGAGRFTPQPVRWVVERSIRWLQGDRRLSRDYEGETSSAEATLYLSSIRHLIRKF